MSVIRSQDTRGLGLAETLVVCLIFSLITTLCVLAVTSGFRMFAQTNVRQSLQRDAGAVFAWMQRDLEPCNLNHVVIEPRTVGTERRDKLGLGGLTSWREPISVDGLGSPSWDKVLLYEATREAQGGLLFRKATAAPATHLPLSFANVDSLIKDVSTTYDTRRLASGVTHFEIVKSVPLECIQVKLLLKEATREIGVNKKRNEALEVQSSIRPRNTFPRL